MAAEKLSLDALHKMFLEQSKQIGKLTSENEALRNQVNQHAQDTVIDLSPKQKLPQKPAELVSYNGKTYRWKLATFTIPKLGTFTAEEAMLDDSQEIIKAIIDGGYGALKEVF